MYWKMKIYSIETIVKFIRESGIFIRQMMGFDVVNIKVKFRNFLTIILLTNLLFILKQKRLRWNEIYENGIFV